MQPDNILLDPALRTAGVGPRNFRRFQVTMPALMWRVALNTQVSLHDLKPSLGIPVCVVDMSLTGLMFLTESFYSPGTRLWLQIRVNNHIAHLPTQVRRNTTEKVDGKRVFGCGVQYLRCEQTAEALPYLAQYLLDRPEVAITPPDLIAR